MKKANSKNNGHSSNGNGNGNGFVATIEPTNGNGNGTKKAEYKVPELSVEEKVEDSIKITPHFDQLTTKGVEILRNMGDIENAKVFIDDLMMQTSNDHTVIGGLLVLFQAIRDKDEKDDICDTAIDYVANLQDHLFKWTWEFNRSTEAYIEAVKTGNFVVEKLVESVSGETVNQTEKSEVKEAPKQSEKAVETIEVYDPQAVEDDSYNPNSMVGLYLDEAVTCGFIRPNVSLVWELNENEDTPEPTIVKETTRTRTDGRFTLEVIFPDASKTVKSAPEISEPESPYGIPLDKNSTFLEAKAEFLQTEAKAKHCLEHLLGSQNFETKRGLVIELLKLNLSSDLTESLISWLEPQRVNEAAPKNTDYDDCITEAARDLDYLIRDETTTPAVQKHIVKGLRETAKSCDFDLTGKTFDVDTLINLLSAYFVKKEHGELVQTVNKNSDAADRYLQKTANELRHVLNSEKVSEDIQNAILHILTSAQNESNFDPLGAELIQVSFPLLIEGMSQSRATGFISSLQAVLESLPSEIREELNAIHSAFYPETPTPKPDVLDLSSEPIEDLAHHLSAVLKNPETPEEIYNVLSDELGGGRGSAGNILTDVVSSPEYIRQVLINLNKPEAAAA